MATATATAADALLSDVMQAIDPVVQAGRPANEYLSVCLLLLLLSSAPTTSNSNTLLHLITTHYLFATTNRNSAQPGTCRLR